MARSTKKTRRPSPGRGSRGKQAAQLGLGAGLLAALTWLTGGFTRENGLEWLKTLLIAGSIALAIRWAVAEPFRIPSGSMEPTLLGDPRFYMGDRVFVNKWIYGLRVPLMNKRFWQGDAPQRWDIVVFRAVEEDAEHGILVKRVVGLPGEHIQIRDGKVYADGEPLELPEHMPDIRYTEYGSYGVRPEDAFSRVPEDHYLLLGDNSARSRDGRVWGWVPNDNLLGRVSCIWWPPHRWRDFTGFSKTMWWRSLLAALSLLVVLRLFVGRSWRVRHSALEGGPAAGDHVYIDRWAFGAPIPFTRRRILRGRQPRRGEVVAYRVPGAGDGLLLGRVAALPGETVYLENGRLTINGEIPDGPEDLLNRTYSYRDGDGLCGRSKAREYALVPPDGYFVLVDDPAHNPDSRSLGWVSREQMAGPVKAVWWPISRRRRART